MTYILRILFLSLLLAPLGHAASDLESLAKVNAVTLAKVAELSKKVEEMQKFTPKTFYGSTGNTDNTSLASNSDLEVTASGQYILIATYNCRSDANGIGRYPVEDFLVNGKMVSRQFDGKNCSNSDANQNDSKTSHVFATRLAKGDKVSFLASGWSVNFYSRASLTAILVGL